MTCFEIAIPAMSAPSYQQLEEAIDECMLADRFRMRRDLKKKKERGRLAAAIDKSSALAASRLASVPDIHYPDELPIAKAEKINPPQARSNETCSPEKPVSAISISLMTELANNLLEFTTT